jgi:hypothetical protein
MARRVCWFLMSASSALVALACSSGGEGRDRPNDGNPTGGAGVGVGGGISVGPTGGVDPSDTRVLPIRKKVCDAANHCSCLRLALLGTLESAAANKDTKPFVDWLNGNSNGTATVTMISNQPTVDAAFLAQYDILLIANVNGWSFDAEEKAAVEQWVRETGGGIISLTGFVSTDAEPAATSQLIEFSGLRYQTPKAAENGQPVPVYYKGGTTDLKPCLGWSGSYDPATTTPIKFAPQTGSVAKLTLNLDYVGAFIGWGISAPADAKVVATDPVSGANMAVAYEIDGKGRVFAFGDEWVVFKSQWLPQGDPNNRQMDQYNPCWVAPAGGAAGFFHSVQTIYQTKQFWFNAINWVAPPNECNFVVNDPDVIIR